MQAANLSRSILIGIVLLAAGGRSIGAERTPAEMLAIEKAQLRQTWEALMAYRKAKGVLPDELANLVPEFVQDPGEPGLVRLLVFAEGFAPMGKTVFAAAGMPEAAVRLAAGRTISGQVLNASRRPLAGVQITLTGWGGEYLPRPRRVAVTDSAGHFTWTGAPKADAYLRAMADGHAPAMQLAPARGGDGLKFQIRALPPAQGRAAPGP